MELVEQEMGVREKSRSTAIDALVDFTGGTIGQSGFKCVFFCLSVGPGSMFVLMLLLLHFSVYCLCQFVHICLYDGIVCGYISLSCLCW